MKGAQTDSKLALKFSFIFICREDTFSTQMLNTVIEQLMSEVCQFCYHFFEKSKYPVLQGGSLSRLSRGNSTICSPQVSTWIGVHRRGFNISVRNLSFSSLLCRLNKLARIVSVETSLVRARRTAAER